MLNLRHFLSLNIFSNFSLIRNNYYTIYETQMHCFWGQYYLEIFLCNFVGIDFSHGAWKEVFFVMCNRPRNEGVVIFLCEGLIHCRLRDAGVFSFRQKTSRQVKNNSTLAPSAGRLQNSEPEKSLLTQYGPNRLA